MVKSPFLELTVAALGRFIAKLKWGTAPAIAKPEGQWQYSNFGYIPSIACSAHAQFKLHNA